MSVIEELLNEIESNELDQQLREICNKIIEEEKESLEYECLEGPNVFLSLPCPGTFL